MSRKAIPDDELFARVLSVSRNGMMPSSGKLNKTNHCYQMLIKRGYTMQAIADHLGLKYDSPFKRHKPTKPTHPDAEVTFKLNADIALSRNDLRRKRVLEACRGCETIWMRTVYDDGHIYCAMPCPQGKGVLFNGVLPKNVLNSI